MNNPIVKEVKELLKCEVKAWNRSDNKRHKLKYILNQLRAELVPEKEALPIEADLNRLEEVFIEATTQCIDRVHSDYRKSLLTSIRSAKLTTEQIETTLETAKHRMEKKTLTSVPDTIIRKILATLTTDHPMDDQTDATLDDSPRQTTDLEHRKRPRPQTPTEPTSSKAPRIEALRILESTALDTWTSQNMEDPTDLPTDSHSSNNLTTDNTEEPLDNYQALLQIAQTLQTAPNGITPATPPPSETDLNNPTGSITTPPDRLHQTNQPKQTPPFTTQDYIPTLEPETRRLKVISYGELGILSNFAQTPFITSQGIRYNSVEHAYQIEKARFFNLTATAQDMERQPDPRQVKILSKTIKKKAPPGSSKYSTKWQQWDATKVQLISTYMAHKFSQHEAARRALIETENATLFHPVPDLFWGTGPKPDQPTGKDMFGRLLMKIRSLLNKQPYKDADLEDINFDLTLTPTKPTTQPLQNHQPPPLMPPSAPIEPYRYTKPQQSEKDVRPLPTPVSTSPLVIIGDSQLSRATGVQSHTTCALISVSGATFRTIYDILQGQQSFPDTWDLVLAVGINSREQDPTKTTGPYIRNMVSAANRKFPNAHIHLTEVAYHQKVPLISARNRYTPVERINYLPHLNHWIPNWITRASHHYRGKLHWIPLPTFPLYFQHDNIHLTTRSATDLVHHWMSTLRSNY